MAINTEQHVIYNILNAPIKYYPFPHFYIKPIFPEPFYKTLLNRLPPIDKYISMSESGRVDKGTYKERYIVQMEELAQQESRQPKDHFWQNFSSWIYGDNFYEALLFKFQAEVEERFPDGDLPPVEISALLTRDLKNYSLPPHSDGPRKMLTLLFYLPPDDSLSNMGTTLYVPKDPDFRCPGGPHHAFENFHRVITMPFAPNSVFGFFKTDNSFHGVEPLQKADVRRDSLIYTIYLDLD